MPPPTTPCSGPQLPPDLALYNEQARSWSNSLPGKPTWGPHLTVQQAIDRERTLIDPVDTAEAWDERADRRQKAWEDSIFAQGFARLCRLPHHARPEYEEP